ncbi:MAG: SIS domain-containing protein [Gammaproteobacteria bacterium]|nr:MAG: SIS domain-containing protein [Gammaproteobacteria bacterium]
MPKDIKDKIKETFEDSISVKTDIIDQRIYEVLIEAGEVIAKSISSGGKLMICGNGGSAADAQHLVAEFLVRLTSEVDREGIPAISLAQDTSTLTACLNDYGSDEIFKRVFSSLANEGDILLAISTSGNSTNVVETLKLANTKGIYTLGFLGGDGGKALKYCDSAFIVPSKVTGRIQESHITAGHAILQYVEDRLLEQGWLNQT